MGKSLHEPLGLESIDGVGYARRMDLEAVADHSERKDAAPAEGEEHECFMTRHCESEATQVSVDPVDEHLLHAHDGNHGGHPVRRLVPALRLPLAPGFFDGVKGQWLSNRHLGMTLLDSELPGPSARRAHH
jgi:hypothetical protein